MLQALAQAVGGFYLYEHLGDRWRIWGHWMVYLPTQNGLPEYASAVLSTFKARLNGHARMGHPLNDMYCDIF